MADGPVFVRRTVRENSVFTGFECTASLGPPSINRGCGRPFEVAEHLGDLVSMCESA